MRTDFASLGLASAAVALAVYGLGRAPPRPAHEAASSTDSISAVVQHLGPPRPGDAADARAAFLRLHQDEIRQTYAVAEVVPGESLAVALVRYSIGGAVFHDVRWLRRVEGQWYLSSTPAPDVSGQGAEAMVGAQRERSVRWLAEGAPRWW